MRRIVGAAVAAVVLAHPGSAHACGGFFCSRQTPVEQAAEEIVFAVDSDAGKVTMHVRISYVGESSDFAWVVPVPAPPTLEVGTDALFPVLSSLRSLWSLAYDAGGCRNVGAGTGTGTGGAGTSPGAIDIVSTGIVGPYETVVLQATDEGTLTTWLTENGFDLPLDVESALAPYVARGQWFVALKLAKDKDVGDLEPIVLTYEGTEPAIPIELTSVAATDDMALRVYVLGEHRAVPTSYLHFALNDLAIDWWDGGSNVEEVIGRAADEAGGHGFLTEYAGPTTAVLWQLWTPAWDTLDDEIAAAHGVDEVVSILLQSGLPADDAVLDVLSDHWGLSTTSTADLDLIDLLTCPGCQAPAELASIVFDAGVLAADLEARVLEPRRRTEALLAAHPKISRLVSSVSPREMTVDPTFAFNPDMEDVPSLHVATERYTCGDRNDDGERAPRVLALADGREVPLPTVRELDMEGLTEFEWLQQQGLTSPATAQIEQAGPSGAPVVLTDNSTTFGEQLEALRDRQAASSGCGCDSGGAPIGAAGIALVVAAATAGARTRGAGSRRRR